MAEQGGTMSLKCFIRLRPVESETNKNGIAKPEGRILYLSDSARPNHSSEFVFEGVFGAADGQAEVFDKVGRPLMGHVLAGHNACCFAYGQTGSGKSYSMFGKESSDWEQRGLVPRAAEQLFKAVAESVKSGRTTVFVSFMEIYLEQVRDLAHMASSSSGKRPASGSLGPDRSNLEIYEDPSGATHVRDLTFIQVSSADDVMSVLKAGYDLRQTAATGQNETSSRSHTLFTMRVVKQEGAQTVTGHLHLVDLAGSERLNKSHSEGARLAETKSINTSLTALGKVVMALAAQRPEGTSPTGSRQHIPFRDSKLTRLLKDSLQGNCFTCVLAALHPHPDNHDECFNTLQFALRCQTVNTAPRVSSGGAGRALGTTLEQLNQQVAQLKQELEFTHAHYQKFIEGVAGPRWSADMGPLERSEEAGPGPASAAAVSAAAEPAPAKANRVSVHLDAPSPKAANHKLNRSTTSMNSLETRMKRAEAQLASQAVKLSQSQTRLTAKMVEAEQFRERMVSKNHTQSEEMMRLRQELKDTRAAMLDCDGLAKHREAEAQRRFQEECARLHVDNEALCAQISAMSSSVNSMTETRGSKALAAQQQQSALVDEVERRLKHQVACTVEEKDRQIENLKQQSTYHLTRKSEEINGLREELEQLQARSQSQVEALQMEAVYLVDYSEKASEVLRRLESGVYPGGDRVPLRRLHVPARDTAGARQEGRLRCLGSLVNGVDRLLCSTVSASESMYAPPSTCPSSISPPSRAQSAGTSHSQVGGLPAFTRRPGSASADEAPPDLEALKARWEVDLKDAITHQVVADFKSDKTVEYIRSLEAQLARYQQEVQMEQQRGSRMSVALRSVGRSVQSHPNSPVMRSLTGRTQGRGAWGLGSSGGAVRMHLQSGGEFGRPGTAAAAVGGGKAAGPGLSGSWGNGSMLMSTSLGSSGNAGYITELGY